MWNLYDILRHAPQCALYNNCYYNTCIRPIFLFRKNDYSYDEERSKYYAPSLNPSSPPRFEDALKCIIFLRDISGTFTIDIRCVDIDAAAIELCSIPTCNGHSYFIKRNGRVSADYLHYKIVCNR